MEHVVSERQVIAEAAHPLCVRLRGAYQDAASLYLLQDWIPGAAFAPTHCCHLLLDRAGHMGPSPHSV